MPKIDIDLFDDAPKVGDKVEVKGKVESIDEDTGMVDISYDDVSIVKKRKKRSDRRDDDDDDTMEIVVEEQFPPQSQTLDQALAQSFPNTQ